MTTTNGLQQQDPVEKWAVTRETEDGEGALHLTVLLDPAGTPTPTQPPTATIRLTEDAALRLATRVIDLLDYEPGSGAATD